MAMDGTVKVPLVGTVKKQYAVGGAVILAVILGVAYYRHSRNASAAAPAAAGAQDPNAIDPATGLTYAEEAAGIQSGTVAGYGSAYGDTSGIVGYDSQGNPIYSDQVGYGPTPSYVNNAAWAQAAQKYLVDTTGADAGTVAAALGVYLAGQPLSQAQASVVQSAIAFFGQPPNQGSNGYPPALRLGSPPGHTVSVPNVVGHAAGDAHNKIVAAGLVPTADPGQKPTDKVTSTSPKGGTHVAHGSQVLITATASHQPPPEHHCPVGMHWDARAGRCVSDTKPPVHHPPPGGKVRVPNVVGQSQENATDNLADVGLKTSGQRPVRGKVRIVTRQSPKAGAEANHGSTVRLTTRVT